MLAIPNTEVMESEEFKKLELLNDWFKYEWGDEHDPTPDDVIEYEEDYELKEISQPELSGTEI